MARQAGPRSAVVDRDGKPFAELDFGAPDHFELIFGEGDIVRVAKGHFEGAREGAPLKLRVRGDDLFMGKDVTTIDGIDLGRVVEVVRGEGERIEALAVTQGGEHPVLAVPLSFVREVAAHIILEPSAEEVDEAQAQLARSPRILEALARAGRPR